MQNIWVYVLVGLVLLNVKRISVFVSLCKLRLRDADWEPVARIVAPGHIQHLFLCIQPELSELGFERVGAMRMFPLLACDPRPYTYSDLYWNPSQACLARVEPAEGMSGKVVSVQFLTTLRDGSALLTLNRELYCSLPFPAVVEVSDPYVDNLKAQWSHHLARVQALPPSRPPESERCAVIIAAQQCNASGQRAYWEHTGFAIQEGEGLFRLTYRGAWKLAGQFSSPPSAARASRKRPYRDPTPFDRKAVVLREMEIVASQMAQAKTPMPIQLKFVLFFGTLALGSVAFGNQLELSYVSALMLVLLIHEFGHLLAMRLFGYRNVSIFFLPFFGAATVGHKTNATPMQEVYVALAGPVLGLIAAAALLLLPSGVLPQSVLPLARSFVSIGFVLNVLNLLPFGILDGGRVIESSVLGCFPYARVAFKALGIGLGILFALYDKNPIFAGMMLALAFGIFVDLKVAGVVKSIFRTAKRSGTQAFAVNQAILALASELADERFHVPGRNSWSQRNAIARRALPILQKPLPGLKTALAGVGLLASIWIVSLMAAASALQHGSDLPLWVVTQGEMKESKAFVSNGLKNNAEASVPKVSSEKSKIFIERYNSENDVNTKWDMLSKYDEGFENGDRDDLSDPERVGWVSKQKEILLAQLPYNHLARVTQRADEAISSVTLSDSPLQDQELSRLRASVDDLTEHGSLSAEHIESRRLAILAGVLQAWVKHASSTQIETQQALINQVSTELGKRQDVADDVKDTQIQASARADFLQGNIEEADRKMREYVTIASHRQLPGGSDAYQWVLIESAQREYAWFLIDAGRVDTALNLALQPHDHPGQQVEWWGLAGWACLVQNRYKEADAYFDRRIEARDEEFAKLIPWWMRWFVYRGNQSLKNQATLYSLDQYIARKGYDPAAAEKLRTSLKHWESLEPQIRAPNYGFWGKRRLPSYRAALLDLSTRNNTPQ